MSSRIGRMVTIPLLAALAGCSGQIKTDYEITHERVAAYIAQHPGLDAETRDAMQHFDLREGMTMEQAIATRGRPVMVQLYRDGQQQYWYFGCDWPNICSPSDHGSPAYRSHAMFENGRVLYWQN